MEKFFKWADASTGVNPFLGPQRYPRFSWPALPVRAVDAAFRLCVLAVRLAILAPLLAAWVAAELAMLPGVYLGLCALREYLARSGGGLPPVAAAEFALGALLLVPVHGGAVGRLRGVLPRLVRSMVAQAILLVLGIWASEAKANPRQLGLPVPKGYNYRVGRPGGTVRAGDVILCNHTCFVDALYLTRRFNAAFATVRAGSGKMDLPSAHVGFGCNGLAATLRSFLQPSAAAVAADGGAIEGVAALSARAKAMGVPVVVFPAIAKDNAGGVLTWKMAAGAAAADGEGTPRVHLAAFSYPSGVGASFAFPSGSLLLYLWWALTRVYAKVEVKMLDADVMAPFPSAAAKKGPSPRQWLQQARTLLAGMLKVKALNVGLEDAVSFHEYLRAVKSGDVKKERELAEKRKKH